MRGLGMVIDQDERAYVHGDLGQVRGVQEDGMFKCFCIPWSMA